MSNVENLPISLVSDSGTLPAMIDRARSRLAEARTSAEVLEARAAAQAAMHYAKLVDATNETVADCLAIVKRAEIRMADEIDAAQGRGELATDATGGGRPRKTPPDTGEVSKPATFKELPGVSTQRLAEWRKLRDAGGEEVVDKAIRGALDEGRAPTNADVRRAAEGSHFRARFTGENEWYTPQMYLELARACLGEIDLDPASSVHAQKHVKATKFFTKSDDGLKHEWHGRVWLNPPFTQPEIVHFVEKLVHEVGAGRTTEAIVLTHNYTDTRWFHHAANACNAVCFTRGRVKFYDSNGVIAAPTQGQAFFYFGENVDCFREHFGDVGFIGVIR